MGHIETGVDRLLALITERKKISIAAASKELGVGKLVITEWAEFLEDEKLISIAYGISSTYLKKREFSDLEIKKKEKEYGVKKDAFVRRVDTALEKLDSRSSGFTSIKDEFETLREDLKKEVSAVSEELKELEKYEALKAKLDADIEEELTKYTTRLKQASTSLSHETKKYEDLQKEIDVEQQKIGKEKEKVNDIKSLEKQFEKEVEKIHGLIAKAKDHLSDQEQVVKTHEKELAQLQKNAENLKHELEKDHKNRLDDLALEQASHEEYVEEIKKKILSQAKEAKENLTADVEEGKRAAKKFESFFDKKINVEKEIKELQTEKKKLMQELEELRTAAKNYKIATNSDLEKHVNDLDKRFKEWEKKHSAHEDKLKKLVHKIFS